MRLYFVLVLVLGPPVLVLVLDDIVVATRLRQIDKRIPYTAELLVSRLRNDLYCVEWDVKP